jgi:polysaccharide biosynthesis PFTS motif protein
MIDMMIFPLVTKKLEKRRKVRLKFINKGYRKLKKENKLSTLAELKDVLTKTKLNNINLFSESKFSMELSIRQYLTEAFLSLSFNESILYSIGANKPLRHPLPKEWQIRLASKNVNIDFLSSTLLWHFYCFLYWGRGVLYGLKSIIFLLKRSPKLGRHAYFNNINSNCISSDIDKYNIINWYVKWRNSSEKLESICHSVDVTPNFSLGEVNIVLTDGLPQVRKFKLLQYFLLLVCLSVYGLFSLFFRPIYSCFLEEVLKFKRANLANPEDFARDYLFHNSQPFYRPIWTYLAEKHSSRILFYFYSTNVEVFKTENYDLIQNPWHLISWPHYLVWDKFQVDFIERLDSHNSIIEEVGEIWFSSSEKSIDIPAESIAVFDVSPSRPTFYITLGLSLDYYNYDISNQFLSNIQSVLNDNNFNMFHKVKRFSNIQHKKYLRRMKLMSKKNNYIKVHPNQDAHQIIQKTQACISMPFTSTALIAKNQGKPSVYYDPSGITCKDDNAAHGIKILTNIDELKEWVGSLRDE